MIKSVDSSRVEKAKDDPDALSDLLDEFWRPIFNYLLRKVADVEIAKDLTQETFLNAFKNFHKFNPQNNFSFSTWLYRIACNETWSINFYELFFTKKSG